MLQQQAYVAFAKRCLCCLPRLLSRSAISLHLYAKRHPARVGMVLVWVSFYCGTGGSKRGMDSKLSEN